MPTPRRSKRHVTMQDIADQCGVTKVTVSRALRGESPRVSQAVAERIRATARELGYDPSSQHVARRLAMRKQGGTVHNNLIGLFLPVSMIDHPYFQDLLAGLMDTAQEERFGLLLSYSNSLGEDSTILPIFAQGDVDAIVVMAKPDHFRPQLKLMRQIPGFGDRPVIFMIHTLADVATVAADDRQGAYDATTHLLSLGHRKILQFYANANDTTTARDRLAGFEDAIRASHLQPADVSVTAVWHYADKPAARHSVHSAFTDHPDITAVLAPNDDGALWLHEFAAELGRSVPHDLSIIGWDDTRPLPDDHGQNQLTTVRVPLREIGRRAAHEAIAQIHAGQTRPTHETIPTTLILRATTAPPPNG